MAGASNFTVAVLVPVLNRAHRVKPLVDSVRSAGRVTRCRVVFIATKGDRDEIDVIRKLEGPDVELVVVDPIQEGWAMKTNLGFKLTEEPFVFTGADDLRFHPGWAERALAKHVETGACVIGTNDLGHQGTRTGAHSTHLLVCRAYGECGTVDEPRSGKIVHEGYGHWQPDAELVGTAKARRTYAHAADSIVEHLHPVWKKAATDATYQKGQSSIAADQALFNKRRRLWEGITLA